MENVIMESCLIMDNREFFMEASKNPDIKARKRTVKNLRKLGVDRAHEVDNKKIIDKLERQLADLRKKYDNKEISAYDYNNHRKNIESQMRKLEKGIDINITDSYGNIRKTRLTSDNTKSDSYNPTNDTININPKTMNSNKFDSLFNHEAGHTEQNKTMGFDNIDENVYDITNKDDYPIKCAKLFLQKNKDKMNSHDREWTELHADFLSCKKSGFGKMIKDVHSFKKSKKEIEDAIDSCIKKSEEEREKITNEFLKYTDEEGNKHVATQKDVEECIKTYDQTKEKLNHYYETLGKRYRAICKKWMDSSSSEDYRNKARKLMNKLSDIQFDTSDKISDLSSSFKHNGINIKDIKKFKSEIDFEINFCNRRLKDLKAGFTTYDYRIKFMEDMYWIHKGHPGRCSMKYPPMTPEDKKYMQEFTVEEMYEMNIITESEYVQLQERIQILTERSE